MVSRAEIVAEARSWIGTPYLHQASLKRVGCDYLIGNHAEYDGVEPYQLVELGELSCLPGDAEIQNEIFRGIAPGTPAAEIDPARDGVAIVEAQRRVMERRGEGVISGFIQLTSVTRELTTTRILRRYPVAGGVDG